MIPLGTSPQLGTTDIEKKHFEKLKHLKEIKKHLFFKFLSSEMLFKIGDIYKIISALFSSKSQLYKVLDQ